MVVTLFTSVSPRPRTGPASRRDGGRLAREAQSFDCLTFSRESVPTPAQITISTEGNSVIQNLQETVLRDREGRNSRGGGGGAAGWPDDGHQHPPTCCLHCWEGTWDSHVQRLSYDPIDGKRPGQENPQGQRVGSGLSGAGEGGGG